MATQLTTSDALAQCVARYPWIPGQPLTALEAKLLRLYVASHPWRAGECGNGIVTPLGKVITWAIYDVDGEPDLEGLPWHELVIRALYPHLVGGDYGDVRGAFKVDIDGSWDERGDLPALERERITRYLAKQAASQFCTAP